jgi:hypothetical protein
VHPANGNVEFGIFFLHNGKLVQDLLTALKTEQKIDGLNDFMGFKFILSRIIGKSVICDIVLAYFLD